MNQRFSLYVWATFALICASLLFGLSRPAQAQGPTPTSTPDVLATLEYQQDELHDLKNDLEDARLDTRKEIISWLAKGTLLSVVLAVLGGLAGAIGMREYLKKRFVELADKAVAESIYRADPSHITLHIPSQGFEAEERSLRRVGFHQIETYTYPNITLYELDGCLIFPAADDSQLSELLDFIRKNRPDPDSCAVIAYRGRYSDELIGEFTKVVRFSVANMLTTIPSQIYAVARGLKDKKPCTR